MDDGVMDDGVIDPDRLVSPTALDTPGGLTPELIAEWRTAGFALLDGLLPANLIEETVVAATTRFPQPGSPESEGFRNFGNTAFPLAGEEVSAITLHPWLLVAVGQLLDLAPAGLRLTQSNLWPKYGRREANRAATDNQDQRIHVDYPNHTLTHPAPWSRPEAVELIIYLSDIADCGGPTAVVPRSGADDPAYRWPIVDSPGIGDLPWINDREKAEADLAQRRPEIVAFRRQLYERELYTDYRPGTVLLYRHDLWHRGTPLIPDTRRLAMNLTFRRAECDWISTLNPGWAWSMYRPDKTTERLIAAASVDQRTVLGFPAPGSAYWCDETLIAVEARYGPYGFDPEPYRANL